MESLTQTLCGICITDQKEIGVAVGIAGSIRSGISTLASTIYIVILNNRLAETIPAAVGPAAVQAGLSSDSITELLDAFATGTAEAFEQVPGITSDILSAAQVAYKEGSRQAFQTIFYVSIAFSGLALLLSFWAPNVDNLMTDQIATILKQKETKPDPEHTQQDIEKE